MKKRILLEPAAEAVSMSASRSPLIFQVPPAQGREILEQIQNSPVCMYPARIQSMDVHTEKWAAVKVFIICPEKLTTPSNVILYLHGAGWVFGSFHTHEKLVRELAARTGCIVIFPEYSRAPEAKFPVAIEQCYEILCKIPSILRKIGSQMNPLTLTVAGDSVGGNMAVAITLLAKWRNGPCIQKLLLYYPVTDANFCTDSYIRFAEGYYLYRQGMIWFWDQYTSSDCERNQILASPLRADAKEFQCFPATMILNGQADVLREEGECFACKLREAGVDVTAVRFQGIIHDFVMLNELNCTNACRAAMALSVSWINEKNNASLRQPEHSIHSF